MTDGKKPLILAVIAHVALKASHIISMSFSLLNIDKALLEESQNIQPKDQLMQVLRAVLAPKLHTDVPEGYCVNQGDAAISERTLLTGGLATCTAVVITSDTHNFVAHVDSETNSTWLAECIEKFIQVGGHPTEITRYNCHGDGLNEFAERISREALHLVNLFEQSVDHNGITGMHSVGAKAPRTEGTRLFSFFGKLKMDESL